LFSDAFLPSLNVTSWILQRLHYSRSHTSTDKFLGQITRRWTMPEFEFKKLLSVTQTPMKNTYKKTAPQSRSRMLERTCLKAMKLLLKIICSA
jgi:hypothetical protein